MGGGGAEGDEGRRREEVRGRYETRGALKRSPRGAEEGRRMRDWSVGALCVVNSWSATVL